MKESQALKNSEPRTGVLFAKPLVMYVRFKIKMSLQRMIMMMTFILGNGIIY